MISYHQLQATDEDLIRQIGDWYQQEWHIPAPKTMANLTAITRSPDEFQFVLLLDRSPVATGGVHHYVGLLDREPRLRVHPYWLALVYTDPTFRGRGYGRSLCHALAKEAAGRGLHSLHLFTDTAESLYLSLGWTVQEKLTTGGRQLSIMQLNLG